MNEENHQHDDVDLPTSCSQKIKELILTGVGWFFTIMKNFQFWLSN
jgi:hypothetical protein